MMMTTTWADFVHRICNQPDDNALRLIAADWLDEHGDVDRAEFIRKQIAMQNCTCAGQWCLNCEITYSHCHKLLSSVGDGTYPHGANWLKWSEPMRTTGILLGNPWHDKIKFEHGFVEHISLTLDGFMNHAPTIFSNFPISSVRLTNVQPHYMRERQGYCWYSAEMTVQQGLPHDIPTVLFNLLDHSKQDSVFVVVYKTFSDAYNDLSQACVRMGRTLAKLTRQDQPTKPDTDILDHAYCTFPWRTSDSWGTRLWNWRTQYLMTIGNQKNAQRRV